MKKLLAICCLVGVVAGCERNRDASPTVEAPSSSSTAPVMTSAPDITVAATTTPTTTQPEVTTTAPAATTAAPSTSQPTTAATTAPSAVPPTTESIAAAELLLGADGVGSALFGADDTTVVEYISSVLGSNTADTGWVPAAEVGTCPGTEARRVEWGVLALTFTDDSQYETGARNFMGWEYGLIERFGDEPVGLRTAEGLTLGDTLADVRAVFPEVSVVEGIPESNIPDRFWVSDEFWGFTSGMTDDAFVTVMSGGQGCGY